MHRSQPIAVVRVLNPGDRPPLNTGACKSAGVATMIDPAWVKGLRAWVRKTFTPKARYASMDDLVGHFKTLRDKDLNRFWEYLFYTKGLLPRGEGYEGSIIERLKVKVRDEIKAARELLDNDLSKFQHALDAMTPGTRTYELDQKQGPQWSVLGFYQRVNPSDPFGAALRGFEDVAKETLTKVEDILSGKLLRAITAFLSKYSEGLPFEPDEILLEYNIGRVKLVYDGEPDRNLINRPDPADPRGLSDYIPYFRKAKALLDRKGLGKLWYGPVFVGCPKCGGENPLGKEFGVGAHYMPGPDHVVVYINPRDFLVDLLIHELGHRYYYKFMSASDRARFDSYFKEVAAVSDYGGKATEEDFAEVFAHFVLGKDMTRDQTERFKAFLSKEDRGRLVPLAREALLADPHLTDEDLHRALRRSLGGGRRASHQDGYNVSHKADIPLPLGVGGFLNQTGNEAPVMMRHATQPPLDSLQVLTDEVVALESLASEIQTVVDTFLETVPMPHVGRIAALQLRSQTECFTKCEHAARHAQRVINKAYTFIQAHPGNATATAVIRDAGMLLEKFDTYRVKSREMLSAMAQKIMPTALKSTVSYVVDGVRAELYEPNRLSVTVFPHFVPTKVGDNMVDGMVFDTYLTVYPLPHETAPKYQQFVLTQSTIGDTNVYIKAIDRTNVLDPPKDKAVGAPAAVRVVLGYLAGWDNLLSVHTTKVAAKTALTPDGVTKFLATEIKKIPGVKVKSTKNSIIMEPGPLDQDGGDHEPRQARRPVQDDLAQRDGRVGLGRLPQALSGVPRHPQHPEARGGVRREA